MNTAPPSHNFSSPIPPRRFQNDTLENDFNEKGYIEFFQDLEEGILIFDFNGKIVYANPVLVKMFGYENNKEVIGQNVFSFFVPKSSIKAIQDQISVLRGKEGFLSEFKVYKKDGSEFWMKGLLSRINFGGETCNWMALQDINKRINVYKGTAIEKEKLYTYLNIADVIFVVLNKEGIVELINKKGCEVLGYNEQEIIGKNWLETFIPEKERKRIQEVFTQIVAGHEDRFRIESNAVKTKSGEERFIEWQNTVIRDKQGNISTTISSGTDVTEQRKMKEILEKSEAKYRSIFENSPETVVLIDKYGVIRDINDKIADLVGYPKEYFIGKAVSSLNIFSDKTKHILQVNIARRFNGETIVPYEIEAVHKDGRKRIATRLFSQIIRDTKRGILGMLVMLVDMTAIKEKDEKLLRLNRVFSVYGDINKAIIEIHDEKKLLEEVCRVIVETGSLSMAWVGIVDSSSHEVIPVAIFGAIKEFLQDIHISTLAIPAGEGPTGTAVREKRYVVSNDVLHDPRMRPWRKKALEKGFNSSGAFPLIVNNMVFGTLNLYAQEENFFSEDEIDLLNKITSQISFALESIENEQTYFHLLNNIEGMVYRSLNDKQRTMKVISEGSKNFIGYMSSEIIDNKVISFADLIHPDDRQYVWDTVQKALKDNQPYQLEYRITTKEGKIKRVWEKGRGILLLLKNEQLLEGIITDVSELQKVKKELHKTEKKYETIVNNLVDALYLHTLEGKIIEVNEIACSISGYTKEELIGANISLLEVKNQSSVTQYSIRTKQLQEKDIVIFDDNLVRKDGKIIPVNVRAKVIFRDKDGFVQTIIRDISERKNYEKKILENEERYKIITDQTGQIIYDYDILTGNIKWFGAIDEVTGYSPLEYTKIGIKEWEAFIHPEDKEEAISMLNRATEKHEKYSVQYRYKRKDGVYFFAEDKGIIFYNKENKPYRMLGIMKDISKQKDVELTLKRRADDLERLNQVMIGRELKMIELKKRLSEAEKRGKDVPINKNK